MRGRSKVQIQTHIAGPPNRTTGETSSTIGVELQRVVGKHNVQAKRLINVRGECERQRIKSIRHVK